MSHPITTGPGGGPAYGSGYQPAAEGTHYQPLPSYGVAPPPPAQRRGVLIAAIAATALLSAGIGAAVGTVVANSSAPDTSMAVPPAPTPGTATDTGASSHAQDVALCTRYAIVNSAIPKPYDNAMDILPAAAALQASLEEYAGASQPVRQAISDVVSAYYARMAVFGGVRERGLAEPPDDDRQAAQAAYDRAWEVCELGAG
ncbi:hypothetical protein BHQ17_16800 [Mycolicibacterium holsaticum]|uniref:Uncharacterized protein n=1 Tax=Mycolicibacterium holsaticum TaxID=152142 RepID=A0A1E3RNC5_9MYCO|nr:hypothetical protein BHQ17_16800 [Mycolicibacterium holsaticum]